MPAAASLQRLLDRPVRSRGGSCDGGAQEVGAHRAPLADSGTLSCPGHLCCGSLLQRCFSSCRLPSRRFNYDPRAAARDIAGLMTPSKKMLPL